MKRTNRREILGSLGALPFLGMASSSKAKSKDTIDAVTAPTFITRSDKLNYERLKALDLDDPEVTAKQRKCPLARLAI